MKAPCLNCSERHFRCHGECEKYAAFHKENEMKSAVRRQMRDLMDFDFEIMQPVRRYARRFAR